jgi:hypothetical protein
MNTAHIALLYFVLSSKNERMTAQIVPIAFAAINT